MAAVTVVDHWTTKQVITCTPCYIKKYNEMLHACTRSLPLPLCLSSFLQHSMQTCAISGAYFSHSCNYFCLSSFLFIIALQSHSHVSYCPFALIHLISLFFLILFSSHSGSCEFLPSFSICSWRGKLQFNSTSFFNQQHSLLFSFRTLFLALS